MKLAITVFIVIVLGSGLILLSDNLFEYFHPDESIDQSILVSDYNIEDCTKTYTAITYLWVERNKDLFILESWHERDLSKKEADIALVNQKIKAELLLNKYLECKE
jgi:hypothetical protein